MWYPYLPCGAWCDEPIPLQVQLLLAVVLLAGTALAIAAIYLRWFA